MIVDAILFYKELDLLELRLNILDPLVDYFIISEAPVMFSGLPKPLYFQESKERFKKFEHKIIHQVVTDTPDDYVNLTTEFAKDDLHRNVLEKVIRGDWWPHTHPPYGRDTYQKECLIRAMNFPDDTIVMISDADEIPNPVVLKEIFSNFDPTQIYNLKQKMYNYYLNCQKVDSPDEVWMGNMILTLANFKVNAMCEMKIRRRGIFVENGGWHFSYLGGPEGALEKMICGNETSLYTEKVKASIQSSIDNCLTNNHDVYFRPCRYIITPIDETYPQYLRDNLDKYKEYIR